MGEVVEWRGERREGKQACADLCAGSAFGAVYTNSCTRTWTRMPSDEPAERRGAAKRGRAVPAHLAVLACVKDEVGMPRDELAERRGAAKRGRAVPAHLAVLACVIAVGCPRVSPQQAADTEPEALEQRFARAERDAGGRGFSSPAHGTAGAEVRPPAARTLWEWDSRAGEWAATDDAGWARARFDDWASEGGDAQAFGAHSFSSWTHWLASAAQSMVASASAGHAHAADCGPAGDEAPTDELSARCGVPRPQQVQHGSHSHVDGDDEGAVSPRPTDGVLDQFSSVSPMPGGFPWIDPTSRLAQDGVMGSNPKGCPSGGVSVGVDGVVYFVAAVPGTRGETILVQAHRPKNGMYVFRKIRMPRLSSGVVSCGALDGGALLGKDVVLCSDEDGTMLQWIEGGTGVHDVPLPAHATSRDGAAPQYPQGGYPSRQGLWLVITPPVTETSTWRDLNGNVGSIAQVKSAWRRSAPKWGLRRGKWVMTRDSSVLVVSGGFLWEREVGPAALLLFRRQVWRDMGRPIRAAVEGLIDVDTWHPGRVVAVGSGGSIFLELDLPTMQWETTELPMELESLEFEAGATLVEDERTTMLFMRTVSGSLVGYRQIFNGSISNQNAIRREWSLHGHPRDTRLAAPPVSDYSGAADKGMFAPSIDGRLWNRRLEPSPECKPEALAECSLKPSSCRCGANGKPRKTWVFDDMGAPPGGAHLGLACSPVAVVGVGRIVAMMRDGSLCTVIKVSSGWKWKVINTPFAHGEQMTKTTPAFAGWLGEEEACNTSCDADDSHSDQMQGFTQSGKKVVFQGHDVSLEMQLIQRTLPVWIPKRTPKEGGVEALVVPVGEGAVCRAGVLTVMPGGGSMATR
jgi:hypothetical protein